MFFLLQIGGEEAELTMLSLSQARAAIGVDVMLDGDRVYYEAEYDPSEYSEYTAEGLVRLMDNITGEFLNEKKISEILLVNEAEAKAIEELHDKDVEHRKFAKVCDLLIEKGYRISNIKEFNEKFKFELDGWPMEYSKEWKSSPEEYVKYLINIVNMKKDLTSLL